MGYRKEVRVGLKPGPQFDQSVDPCRACDLAVEHLDAPACPTHRAPLARPSGLSPAGLDVSTDSWVSTRVYNDYLDAVVELDDREVVRVRIFPDGRIGIFRNGLPLGPVV